MGYTTEFEGVFTVTPPLNEFEVAYLTKFASSRRMQNPKGPYYVDGGMNGSGFGTPGVNFNRPAEGQPGLYCQWLPTPDGTGIEWDGEEKFYAAEEWIVYIIDHFLTADSVVAKLVASDKPEDRELLDPVFQNFDFFHVVNGTVYAQGEDPEDRWRIVVKNNKVEVQHPKIMWPASEEENDW